LNKTSATGAHRIPITIPIPILFYFLLSKKFTVNKVKGWVASMKAVPLSNN
jgi:hypothetical protein